MRLRYEQRTDNEVSISDGLIGTTPSTRAGDYDADALQDVLRVARAGAENEIVTDIHNHGSAIMLLCMNVTFWNCSMSEHGPEGTIFGMVQWRGCEDTPTKFQPSS